MKLFASAVLIVTVALAGLLPASADTVRSGNAGLTVSKNYNSVKKSLRVKSTRKSKKLSSRSKSRRALAKARSGKSLSKGRSARRAKYLAMARSIKPSGLPISLVDAVISMESGYRPNARGRHGEIGLMQIKPATARMVRSLTGVRGGSLANPKTNLRVGMAYLNWCRKKAKGNISATIGCYNAGPGNMWRWQKFAVTRKYVRYVRSRMGN